MKIGKIVKAHIKQIFSHCDNVAHDAINSLLDPNYSKQTLGINFPFCAEVEKIPPDQSKRYWTEVYLVRGRLVRVTSQWFESSKSPFIAHLASIGIALDPGWLEDDDNLETKRRLIPKRSKRAKATSSPSSRANSRYRGNAIGNAQNLFVRNILSSIGAESFNESDWNATKADFSNKCAYCGNEGELHIEHAIPINKSRLGEHRLGNLVPSCNICNRNKAGKDFREFLAGNQEAIAKIESHMDRHNYASLEKNEQVEMILNLAHQEVGALADRYITIINELFTPSTATTNEKDNS